MISHYFKLAKKNLIKNKYYTIINVVGLVFGMLSALIIAKYIGGSLQSDSFHVNKDRIYSLTQQESSDGNQQKERNSTYLGVADLISQVPDAAGSTKYYQHVESLIISEKENGDVVSFTEGGIFITDSSFLKIFSFPFVQGSEHKALVNSNSLVLTKAASKRYFGNLDPIGKTLTIRAPWGKENTYEVTGVTEDIPNLSRFNFDFLITQTELSTDEFWNVPEYSIYVLLKENANPSVLGEKLTATLKNVPQLKSANKSVTISLESLSHAPLSLTDNLLLVVGIFIILITWINYINQILAQSYWRIKEVGVLRIMGATRMDLKIQFVIESSQTCLISLIFIVIIYLGLEPSMQSLTNGHLLPLVGEPTSINLIIIAIFAIGTIIAATVPTIVLLSQNFGASLRNIYSTKMGSIGLRKALVIFQFSISTVLMISIFVISGQLEYLQIKDKGVDLNDIIVVKTPMAKDTTWNAKRKILQLFKERCAEVSIVAGVTSSTTVPGEEYRHETFLSFEDRNSKILVHQNGVDEHFFSVYKGEFVAGHDFIPDARDKNRTSIILNESAAKALGIFDYETAINSKIVDQEAPEISLDLIGIVKDYHQTSMKYEVKPMAFKFNIQRGHCSLKIRTSGLYDAEFTERLASIKQIWKESYPDASFDYFFLDEKFAAQDKEDQYFGRFFKYFTVLSIIISCLGLFGLSLLISTKRQREIGVRKVFGATSLDILAIFLKGYLGPLSISVVVGSPLAYLLMNMWLSNYAYRIEIGFGVIFLAILSLTIIFLFTVSYHTIKASITNPVTILRD
jgi:putative ABC transport system permease protein